MSFNPMLRSVMVEVPKGEYDELVSKAARIDAVERLVAATTYPTVKDLIAVLGIEGKEKEKEKENG